MCRPPAVPATIGDPQFPMASLYMTAGPFGKTLRLKVECVPRGPLDTLLLCASSHVDKEDMAGTHGAQSG